MWGHRVPLPCLLFPFFFPPPVGHTNQVFTPCCSVFPPKIPDSTGFGAPVERFKCLSSLFQILLRSREAVVIPSLLLPPPPLRETNLGTCVLLPPLLSTFSEPLGSPGGPFFFRKAVSSAFRIGGTFWVKSCVNLSLPFPILSCWCGNVHCRIKQNRVFCQFIFFSRFDDSPRNCIPPQLLDRTGFDPNAGCLRT